MTLTWMTSCRVEFIHTEESTCHLFIQPVNCGSFLINHSILKKENTHTWIWLILRINIYPKYIYHPLPYFYGWLPPAAHNIWFMHNPSRPQTPSSLSLCFYDLTNLSPFAASVLLHPYSISPQQCHHFRIIKQGIKMKKYIYQSRVKPKQNLTLY